MTGTIASVGGESPATKPSFYHSTLFQILTIGIISFLAPGLWNATNSLGAGGALLPYLYVPSLSSFENAVLSQAPNHR